MLAATGSDKPGRTPRRPFWKGLASSVLVILACHSAAQGSDALPPAAPQRWLDPMEGRWSVEMTWGLPGRDQRKTSGHCLNRLMLGGRFLQVECGTGEAEARKESLAFLGFDDRKRQFFALGMDNTRSYYFQPWGNYDQASRSFILSGKERDEATGRVLSYRLLLRVEGPNRHRIEVFLDTPAGPPVPILEGIYTRVE